MKLTGRIKEKIREKVNRARMVFAERAVRECQEKYSAITVLLDEPVPRAERPGKKYLLGILEQFASEIRRHYYSARRDYYRARLGTAIDEEEARSMLYKMNKSAQNINPFASQ